MPEGRGFHATTLMSVNRDLTMKATVVLDPSKAKQGLQQVDQAAKQTKRTLLENIKAWEEKDRKIKAVTRSAQTYANATGKAMSILDRATGQRTSIGPASFANRMFGGRGEQGMFGGMVGNLFGAGAVLGLGKQTLGGIGTAAMAGLHGGYIPRGSFGMVEQALDFISGRNFREQREDRMMSQTQREQGLHYGRFVAEMTGMGIRSQAQMARMGDLDYSGKMRMLNQDRGVIQHRMFANSMALGSAQGRVGGIIGSGTVMGDKSNDLLRAQEELKRLLNQQKDLQQKLLEIDQRRLEINKAQAEQTRQGAVGFGMRSPEERMALTAAAKHFKAGVATKEERDLLGSTPEGQRVLSERAGAATLRGKEYGGFLGDLGLKEEQERFGKAQALFNFGNLFGMDGGRRTQDAAINAASGVSGTSRGIEGQADAMVTLLKEIAKNTAVQQQAEEVKQQDRSIVKWPSIPTSAFTTSPKGPAVSMGGFVPPPAQAATESQKKLLMQR